MSILIYAEFESTDAAELAAMKLKRYVPGARVAGLSKKWYADNSEESSLYLYPYDSTLTGGNQMNSGINNLSPAISSFFVQSVRDPDFEPAQQRDVRMRVEVDDEQESQKTQNLLRSMGGLQVRRSSQPLG